ncbi:Embryonic polyadenylate-binding protein 2-B [Astathelohania contejeani]|uniref:Embryonic polyadenylate-binding protein 2-B n=1 Tax=Astathelohania contejeani TaxID=164912 RepID=A0ABQ7I0C6_9MICR|nr:Embryonic polyadenylate-binding protein 2-B [Thelohania contejeani]
MNTKEDKNKKSIRIADIKKDNITDINEDNITNTKEENGCLLFLKNRDINNEDTIQPINKEEDETAILARMQEEIINANTKPEKVIQKNTVIVKNIGDKITKKDLFKHFKSCGYINSIRITKGKNGSVGYIEFNKENSVEIALNMHSYIIKGRNVIVKRKK